MATRQPLSAREKFRGRLGRRPKTPHGKVIAVYLRDEDVIRLNRVVTLAKADNRKASVSMVVQDAIAMLHRGCE